VLLRNFFPVAESTAREVIPPGAPPILEAFEVEGMDGITDGYFA